MTTDEKCWEFGLVSERQAWARMILSHLFSIIPRPSSMVDIGGGAGSWAAVAKEMGVEKVRVLDRCSADQVVKSLSREEHVSCDLEGPLPSIGGFDLAISIEVVEHLTPSAGQRVVEHLIHSSEVILFSAAVPGQGGIGHINEQRHDYWHCRFSSLGYRCYDVLRSHLVSCTSIPWFLRQNLFVYALSTGKVAQQLEHVPAVSPDIEIIGKESLDYLYTRTPGLREIIAAFPDALRKALWRKLGH